MLPPRDARWMSAFVFHWLTLRKERGRILLVFSYCGGEGKQEERLNLWGKSSTFQMIWLAQMRPLLGVKYLPRLTLHLRCLPVPCTTLCVPLQAQLSDLWSAVMNLISLQFEPMEIETHGSPYCKPLHIQLEGIRSKLLWISSARFGCKAVEERLYLMKIMYIKISKMLISSGWFFILLICHWAWRRESDFPDSVEILL